jgi:hypothetical protein
MPLGQVIKEVSASALASDNESRVHRPAFLLRQQLRERFFSPM